MHTTPAGERGPGNPLFSTNFAGLALGPTLTAKYVCFLFVSGSSAMGGHADDITSFSNPTLRSRGHPPALGFSNAHDIRMGVMRGRRGKPSWADGWDPTKHEYVVTASGGGVGGH